MNSRRWEIAQTYEKMFWQKAAERIATGEAEKLNWYSWRAQKLDEFINPFKKDFTKKSKILEIGCGPVGIISYLKRGERYAIDPLDGFYLKNKDLSEIRDEKVLYRQGRGEDLPFDDNVFTLVILDNVLDHTEEAEKTLEEVNRVLKKNGYFYIAVNIHTTWGKYFHMLLSKMNIDKGHPHSYNLKNIREIITKNNFKIMKEKVGDYKNARDHDRNSTSMKDKTKGYTGISEFLYSALAIKV